MKRREVLEVLGCEEREPLRRTHAPAELRPERTHREVEARVAMQCGAHRGRVDDGRGHSLPDQRGGSVPREEREIHEPLEHFDDVGRGGQPELQRGPVRKARPVVLEPMSREDVLVVFVAQDEVLVRMFGGLLRVEPPPQRRELLGRGRVERTSRRGQSLATDPRKRRTRRKPIDPPQEMRRDRFVRPAGVHQQCEPHAAVDAPFVHEVDRQRSPFAQSQNAPPEDIQPELAIDLHRERRRGRRVPSRDVDGVRRGRTLRTTPARYLRRMPITTRSRVVALLLVLGGCGGDDDGGTVTPSRVTAADLEGYWVAEAPPDDIGGVLRTTFGFTSAERAPLVLPFALYDLPVPEGDPVSVVYRGIAGSADQEDIQYATYSVDGGRIHQIVLGDIGALPGTEYSTQILQFTRGESMTIESDLDPSGARTYRWHARCPLDNAAGWQDHRGHLPDCAPGLALGASIAFDARGDLHAVHGIGEAARCETPTYAYVSETCIPRFFELPMFRWSAVDVTDGVVRIALTLIDERVVVFARRLDEPDFGPAEVLDPTPGTARAIRFLGGAERPTVLWNGTTSGLDTVLHRYTRQSDGTWTKDSDEAIPYPFDATLTPTGDVIFANEDGVQRVTVEGTPVGAPIAMPSTRRIAPLHVTPSGRIQLVYSGDALTGPGGAPIGNGAVFAEWNGTAWEEIALGAGTGEAWIVSHDDGPARVVTIAQSGPVVDLVLHTIEDGQVRTELGIPTAPFGAGGRPDYVRPSAVVGPAGHVAFVLDGRQLWIRRDEPLVRQPATLSVTFPGDASGLRVFSEDGRFECTSDCTLDVEVGERIFFQVDAPPGWRSTLSCYESSILGRTNCFVPIRAATQTLSVTAERTPVQRTLFVGGTALMSVGTAFDVRGDRLVMQADFNPGATNLVVGTTELTLGAHTPYALVGYERTSGDAWITPIPVATLAIAAAADGGAWLVASVLGSATFGATSVGTPGTTSLVRARYDAAGSLVDVAALASGASFVAHAADVDPDGVTVAAVTDGATRFFLHANATGTPTRTELPLVGMPTKIVLDGARSVLALDTGLVTTNGAAIAGSRALSNATTLDVAIHGERVVALVNALGPVDFGGGPRTGDVFVARYDGALAHVADVMAITGTGRTNRIAMVTDATIVAVADQVLRYDPSLDDALEPLPYDLGTALASGQDDDSLMLMYPGMLVELRPE